MKKRVIIVHRWSGSPTSDWYPWLKSKLEKRGFEVVVPVMGDTEEPTISEWVDNLPKVVGEPNEWTLFVCHSIGTQTVWRYLEGIGERKVGGVVAVAPWFHLEHLEDEDVERIVRPWLETPIDFAEVRRAAEKVVAFFSDNDPYGVSQDTDGVVLKEKLGAELVLIPEAGHFTEDDGYTEFPEVLDVVLQLARD
ncbi:alpha/beta hydrolase [Candidatus Wolfebacteria bacterium]|nr:alpha/beta hydrolase [Candidatus Wolfebacteria bacterium]